MSADAKKSKKKKKDKQAAPDAPAVGEVSKSKLDGEASGRKAKKEKPVTGVMSFNYGEPQEGDAAVEKDAPGGVTPRSTAPPPVEEKGRGGPTVIDTSGISAYSNEGLAEVLDVKYASGQQAALFLPDGSGFCYYHSGRPAICISAYKGRTHSLIYDDSALQEPLATFTPQGTGTVFLPGKELKVEGDVAKRRAASKPRLMVTRLEGVAYHDSGEVERSWRWAEGIGQTWFIQITQEVSMAVVAAEKIVVSFRSGPVALDFNFGSHIPVSTETYLSKVVGTEHVGPLRGKLVLDVAATPLATLSRPRNYHLPVRSASPSRAEINSPLFASLPASVSPAPSPSRPRAVSVLGGSSAARGGSAGTTSTGPRSPSPGPRSPAKAESTHVKRALVLLRPKSYDEYLASPAVRDKLVVVSVIDPPRSSPDARTLETKFQDTYHRHCVLAGGPSRLDWIAVKFEAESDFLRKRHRVLEMPAFLMYYNAQPVFADRILSESGDTRFSEPALMAEINRALMLGRERRFLAPDFEIPQSREAQAATAAADQLRTLLSAVKKKSRKLTAGGGR